MISPEALVRELAVRPPDPGRFGHAHHVAFAWHHARTGSGLDGLAAVDGRLREIARAHGQPERYHETLTWGWYLLIRERIARGDPDATWEEFGAANPDVLDGSALGARYGSATLASELARRVFVLPDRGLA